MFKVYEIVELSCGCEPPCTEALEIGAFETLELAIEFARANHAWFILDQSGVRVWDDA